ILDRTGRCTSAEADRLCAKRLVVRPAYCCTPSSIHHISGQTDTRSQSKGTRACAGDVERHADVLGTAVFAHVGGGGDAQRGALIIGDGSGGAAGAADIVTRSGGNGQDRGFVAFQQRIVDGSQVDVCSGRVARDGDRSRGSSKRGGTGLRVVGG